MRGYQKLAEAAPDKFIRYQSPDLLKNARVGMARMLNVPADECVFVQNTTLGKPYLDASSPLVALRSGLTDHAQESTQSSATSSTNPTTSSSTSTPSIAASRKLLRPSSKRHLTSKSAKSATAKTLPTRSPVHMLRFSMHSHKRYPAFCMMDSPPKPPFSIRLSPYQESDSRSNV